MSVGRWQQQEEEEEQVVFQAGLERQVPQGLLATCTQNFEGDRIKKKPAHKEAGEVVFQAGQERQVPLS